MGKARVFVLPEGKIQIFIDEASEEEAKVATRAVLAKLQASGVPINQDGDIELHRTGGADHVHVVQQQQSEVKHE